MVMDLAAKCGTSASIRAASSTLRPCMMAASSFRALPEYERCQCVDSSPPLFIPRNSYWTGRNPTSGFVP
eukprot:1830137-Rhodomonas_salina.1